MNGGLPNSEIDSLPYCRQNLRFEFRAQRSPPESSIWLTITFSNWWESWTSVHDNRVQSRVGSPMGVQLGGAGRERARPDSAVASERLAVASQAFRPVGRGMQHRP